MSAFIIISALVILVRKKYPEIHRPFTCPAVPLIPILATIFVLCLMLYVLPNFTKMVIVIFLAIGFVIYFGYSKNHTAL